MSTLAIGVSNKSCQNNSVAVLRNNFDYKHTPFSAAIAARIVWILDSRHQPTRGSHVSALFVLFHLIRGIRLSRIFFLIAVTVARCFRNDEYFEHQIRWKGIMTTLSVYAIS